MSKNAVYGIDLGTTFSAISKLNNLGKPEIIANIDGENITPSAVLFTDPAIVGSEAIKGSFYDSELFVEHIKQHMEDKDFKVKIEDKEFSPAQVSSMILKKLTQDAATSENNEVKDVIITVPANFADNARTATIEAGNLAGLNVIGLVNEPTAAVVHASIDHNLDGTTLIFDLGGGTFDITIAKINGTEVDVIASGGDRTLGGVNFDEALLNYISEEYKKETGKSLYENESQKIKQTLEMIEIKKTLSKREKASFVIGKEDYSGTITRDKFEELISEYTSRIEMLLEVLIEDDAKINAKDIDHVLLVGGSTRIPCMKNVVKKVIGKEPLTIGNVDESVALGASISAGVRMIKEDPSKVSDSAKKELQGVSIKDVTPRHFGTKSLDGNINPTLVNSIILEKNISIPCSEMREFCTIVDGQETIKANVTQTDDPSTHVDLVDVVVEADFELPPDTPRGSIISVTYSYDEDGVMLAVFEHVDSGKTLEFKGNPKSGFKTEETINESASMDDFTIE